MGLPNEAPEEMEPEQGHHVRKRLKCPSPTKSKRPRTRLAESGQIRVAGMNQRGNPAGSCCVVGKDAAGRDEEAPMPPHLVTSSSSVRASSDPSDQEVAQEEATLDVYLPPGWTPVKLEPDW